MEKQNNAVSAAEADLHLPCSVTDNSYATSSGSDSEDSNASLLEKSSLLCNKFMLPKDFCDHKDIFDEFFSTALWDELPSEIRKHLLQFLPESTEDPASVKNLVNDLLSHKLQRFGVDQMTVFRQNLSDGNYRTDMVKLQANLAKSMLKERRMVELQRMARLAKKVVLSRERAMLAEQYSHGMHSMAPSIQVDDVKYRSHSFERKLPINPELEKCRSIAKKRYLSELLSISDNVGLSLSISDEEDCLDTVPNASVRKQRRMFGTGLQTNNENSTPHGYAGMVGSTNLNGKKSNINGCSNNAGGNAIDGTVFNVPKLFLVTDDHYQKLLMQHRKRKMDEPDHPELDLDGIKLKDVVSRTQIAAGYRRILPLPKVYVADTQRIAGSTTVGKWKMKSHKLIKSHRFSLDNDDSKPFIEARADTTNAKAELHQSNECDLKVEVEPSIDTDEANSETNLLPSSHDTTTAVCKKEQLSDSEVESSAITYTNEMDDASFTTQSQENEEGSNIVPCQSQTTSPNTSSTLCAEETEPIKKEHDSVKLLLGNETHACFLSLIRDLFCSNPDHRSTMADLQLRLDSWTSSSIATRNSWFEEYQNNNDWHGTLQSAVQFLTGDLQHQPEDFVPYIEHKVSLNILQWIGASRDGDSRLVPLCAYWRNRKQVADKSFETDTFTPSIADCTNNISTSAQSANTNDVGVIGAMKMKSKSSSNLKLQLSSSSSSSPSSSVSSMSSLATTGDASLSLLVDSVAPAAVTVLGSSVDDDGTISERSISPPPPRFPTDWSVRKATDDEIQNFREQEKRRYENPHLAFTYKQHSYNSVVGPVKGIYTQVPGISKARGHNMLAAGRPNFVTILTLVRDATARLPNGEGTRADICELLKSSQYIIPSASDQILQTIVSGALDRMHTEHDPCVKYDAKRKIWIYLHRNRTEAEFQRLHKQFQGYNKQKKSGAKKALRYTKESSSYGDSCSSSDNFSAMNSMVEMDQDTTSPIGSNTDIPTITSVMGAQSKPTAADNLTDNFDVVSATRPTSLLKKQPSHTVAFSNVVQQQPNMDKKCYKIAPNTATKITLKDATVQQHSFVKQVHSMQKDSRVPSQGSPADSSLKVGPKTNDGVALITSAGSNVKTIQIPNSSISLATKPRTSSACTIVTNRGPSSDAFVMNSASLDTSASSFILKSPKNVYVSALVSSGKSTLGTTSVSMATCSSPKPVQARKSVPAMGQSIASSSPLLPSATYSFVSTPKDGIKIGGAIVSIRQVNNSSSDSVGQVPPSTSAVPQSIASQISIQTKGIQLPIANTAIITPPGSNVLQSTKVTNMITATIGNPIYSTSGGASTIKHNPTSIPGLPASATTVLSQKMAATYSPVTSGGSGVPTVVAIRSTSPVNMATIPTSSGRVITPSTSLINTITLAKGQQSILTAAQQKQIIQNLLTQQQKQVLTKKKIVSHAAVLAASPASSVNNQPVESKPFMLDNQSNLGTIPTYKIHQNASQKINALSPQIVKITSARTKTANMSPLGPNKDAVGSSSSSPSIVAQDGVKTAKAQNSNLLTFAAGTMSNDNGMAPTNNATVRVLKNMAEPGSELSVPQMAQSSALNTMQKIRKDSSTPVGSKVIVTNNANTGQLIPLESLLHKQGITTPGSNSSGTGSTYFKISGTNKTGQQFLQFSTGPSITSAATPASVTNIPSINAITSTGHQYTLLSQARSVISVTSTAATKTNHSASVPVSTTTTVSSESVQSRPSPTVSNNKSIIRDQQSSSTTDTSVLSHVASSSNEKQMQQATKVKLVTTTQGSNSFSSPSVVTTISAQQSTTAKPAAMSAGGEILNAKIIGVRNVSAGKLKGASPLSLMNANNLNIAHICGKPIIIANNSTLAANPSVTMGNVRFSGNNNSTVPNASTGPILVSANASNPSNLAIDPQKDKPPNVNSTGARFGAGTTAVSGLPGQTQAVMLRNHLLKVQTMQPTVATRMSQQKPGNVTKTAGSSGAVSSVSGTLVNSTAGCTVVQQHPSNQFATQSRTQSISSPGNATSAATSSTPSNMTMATTIVGTTLSKSVVKIKPANSGANSAKVSEAAPSKTSTQRLFLSQPIIIPSNLQSSGSINLKRLKVIPINKQCKK